MCLNVAKNILYSVQSIFFQLFITSWSNYHTMYVNKICKSYIILKRQLFTNLQNLKLAEIKGPVRSLSAS